LTGSAEWLPVPGYEGIYLMSSAGDVYSLARRQADGRVRSGMMLCPSRSRKGYWRVKLYDAAGVCTTWYIHDLVMLTFHAPKPPGMHVLHQDDDKDRNHRDRLRYGTPKENERDKRRRRSRLGQRRGTRRGVIDVTVDTPTGCSWLIPALESAP
jgi:hypothetical protein